MQTFQNTTTVRDSNNQIIPNALVSWESRNTAVATVSSTGLITAVSPGTAVIVASSGGAQSACVVTVTA
jgi:uncharacterized protein YjdB